MEGGFNAVNDKFSVFHKSANIRKAAQLNAITNHQAI